MIDMLGMNHIARLADLSSRRSIAQLKNYSLEHFYMVMQFRMGITEDELKALYDAVDTYEKYFCISDQSNQSL